MPPSPISKEVKPRVGVCPEAGDDSSSPEEDISAAIILLATAARPLVSRLWLEPRPNRNATAIFIIPLGPTIPHPSPHEAAVDCLSWP